MIITDVAIDSIKPYENNPRYNDEAVKPVMNSIKEFGFRNPIIIDKNNVIVCGHTRFKAAQKLKLQTVPVIQADDLSEEQINAFRLADNKVGEIATWDEGLLTQELEKILDIDMTDFGFDFPDAAAEESENENNEVQEDDYDEELDQNTEVQYGDIYKLGDHILMCGDSTSVEDVEKLMGETRADLLVTDPPYNVAIADDDPEYAKKRKRRTDGKIVLNDSMESQNFREFIGAALGNADKVMKPGASFYIFHSDIEGYNFRGACIDIGWKVRQCIIWDKGIMVLGRQDYQVKHEPILYGWKEGTHLWASDRKQTTLIEIQRPVRSKLHPTMKPVKLFDYLIRNNTKESDIVLDLFNGSGTTIIACEQNKRIARCMELDPLYVDATIKRWETLTGKTAEKVSSI